VGWRKVEKGKKRKKNPKVGPPAVCCGVFHFRRGKIT